MTDKTPQPLQNRMVIVNPDGTPTDYFIRWAQERQKAILDTTDAGQVQTIAEDVLAARKLIGGTGIDVNAGPEAFLSSDVTIDAKIQELLDVISSTRGSVLYRGNTAWAALAPGTAGQVLSTNGAGADPSWITAGGGGGGTTATIVQVGGVIANNFTLTLPGLPTLGNLLVAFAAHWNNLTGPGTGWTLVSNTNGLVTDGVAIAVKVASSSDTATQIPFVGGTGGSSVVVYELSGALAVVPFNWTSDKEITASPFTMARAGSRANGLILGAVFRGGNNSDFTVPTYTTDLNITGTTANNSPRRVQGIHLASGVGVNGNVSTTFSGGNFAGALLEILGG